jgi:hypothetical protein
MQILSLHELCQQELPRLLDARYMPTGWNRTGCRLARRKDVEAGGILAKVLTNTADRLVPRPDHARMAQLLTQAAQERTIASMVEKMVILLEAERAVDQADAFAAAETTDHYLQLGFLMGDLEQALLKVQARKDVAQRAGLDLSATLEHLERSLSDTKRRHNELESALYQFEHSIK